VGPVFPLQVVLHLRQRRGQVVDLLEVLRRLAHLLDHHLGIDREAEPLAHHLDPQLVALRRFEHVPVAVAARIEAADDQRGRLDRLRLVVRVVGLGVARRRVLGEEQPHRVRPGEVPGDEVRRGVAGAEQRLDRQFGGRRRLDRHRQLLDRAAVDLDPLGGRAAREVAAVDGHRVVGAGLEHRRVDEVDPRTGADREPVEVLLAAAVSGGPRGPSGRSA
jgi:hypothetical protein